MKNEKIKKLVFDWILQTFRVLQKWKENEEDV